MSLKTWKEEFYPIPASKVAKKDAVEHSLRKWRGARKSNLKRHGITKDEDDATLVSKYGRFRFGCDECALCARHSPYRYPEFPEDCETCPLFLVRGGVMCTSRTEEEDRSPYHSFVDGGNPAPMIRWLEKAKRFEAAQAKQGRVR